MSYGELAYSNYLRYAKGKSLISGEDLPPYSELPEQIKRAWEYAAGAVANQVYLEQGA